MVEKDTQVTALPFEPLPQFRPSSLQDDSALADNRGRRIGILIVAYNAVTTLTRVLKRITPNVWRNVEQVLVFDDASQDSTFELAVGIKTLVNLPKLHILKHPKNLGYGGNQKAGYQYFIEHGIDVVVLLHGDGQYAPEILAHLYSPIVRGDADAVFGSRMMKTYGGPLKGGMPLYKYVGNRILTAMENKALGLGLTEFHSGYRAYNLHALRQIDFSHMTNDFHFDTEIIIKLHHQHFTIHEVPIPTFYGSEICYVNGLRYAKDVARAVWRYTETTRAVRPHPEFQEYFVPCPIKRSKYSSHYYALKLVGHGREVLEFGCEDGALAAELAKNGNRVTGVGSAAQTPRGCAIEWRSCADLDSGIEPLVRDLNQKKFDRILLLDVLEHLQRPQRLLDEAKKLLAPRGVLIVSVPNVANFTIRAMLLAGKFEYTDRGILDWGHMRFFTRKSIRRLLRQSGYQVIQQRCTIIPLERLVALRPEGRLLRGMTHVLGLLTRVLPGLLGYQVVLVGQARDAAESGTGGR